MDMSLFKGRTYQEVQAEVAQAAADGWIDDSVSRDWMLRIKHKSPNAIVCAPCIERYLIWQTKEKRKEVEMGKVIKVDDEFYNRIKSMAENEGKAIGETVEAIANPAIEAKRRFEEARKVCSEELGIPVAVDPAWEERMLQIIPPGMSPALDRIRHVYSCAIDKIVPKVEEVTESGPGEVTEETKTEVAEGV